MRPRRCRAGGEPAPEKVQRMCMGFSGFPIDLPRMFFELSDGFLPTSMSNGSSSELQCAPRGGAGELGTSDTVGVHTVALPQGSRRFIGFLNLI